MGYEFPRIGKEVKMKNLKKVLSTVSLALLIVGLVAASDTASQSFTLSVLDICVLGVTGNPGNLTIVAPASGGETPANPTDDSTYAVYTSVVGSSQTRAITANWGGSDAAPAGCTLRLEVTEIAGTNEGSAESEITVSDTAQNIITGVGSCATGIGAGGAKLKYTLSVDTVTSLVAGSSESVTITLTMTDAS